MWKYLLTLFIFLSVSKSNYAAPSPETVSPNEYFKNGLSFYNLGNYTEAIKQYNIAIGLDPSRNFFYYHRGNAYNAIGAKGSAVEDYKKSMSLKETPEALYKLCVIMYEDKNYLEAFDGFKKVKEQRDDFEKLNYYLGALYHNEGNLDKSEECLNKYLTNVKTHSDAYLYMAMNQAKRGNNEKAVDYLKRSLMYNTTDWKVYYKFYEVYLAMGDNEKALYNLSMVIELGQRKSEFYKVRSELYTAVGDNFRAKQDLEYAGNVTVAK